MAVVSGLDRWRSGLTALERDSQAATTVIVVFLSELELRQLDPQEACFRRVIMFIGEVFVFTESLTTCAWSFLAL